MNKMIAAIAALSATVSATTDASVAWQGTLYNVHVMHNGVVLLYTTGSRSNIPACGQGQPSRFAFDSTTPGGKSLLAGILSADATKRQLVIVGSETCSVYPDSEGLNYFYFND